MSYCRVMSIARRPRFVTQSRRTIGTPTRTARSASCSRRSAVDRIGTALRRAGSGEASALTAAAAQQLARGELTQALATFQKATAVLNTYAPAFYQMGRTLQRLGRESEAGEAFARARQLNPSLTPPRNIH
jgi:tetratricopeptide (TPR) repeat protein